MSARPANCIVVGEGIIGLCSAVALQRSGMDVTLIGPETAPRGASWGNAGHIAVEQVSPLASPAMIRGFHRRLFVRGGPLSLPPRDLRRWLPFSLRLLRASSPARFERGKAALSAILATALPAWRRLLTAIDASHLLREDGHFIVWETGETARAGRAAWMAADSGTARFRAASAEEIAVLQARTSVPIAGALRCEGSGQIMDLGALGQALQAYFLQIGGTHAVGRVDRIAGSGHVTLDDGRDLRADAVLVAAGAASGALLAPLGIKVPIIAERGYHIQTAKTDWPCNLPPVVFEDRALIVTRFTHGLRAASFVEFGRIDAPADRRKWQRLRRHVRALGLAFQEPLSEWMGARPTLPDYLPAIGRSRGDARLFYAFGHQHLGLTLAATTGEAVAALIGGASVPIDLDPFDIARFA